VVAHPGSPQCRAVEPALGFARVIVGKREPTEQEASQGGQPAVIDGVQLQTLKEF
jgi:hypothetical protein